jgi:hypothetical protein
MAGHYHKYCVHLGVEGAYHFMLPAACEITGFQEEKNLINHCGALIIDFTLDDQDIISTFLPQLLPFKPGIELDYSKYSRPSSSAFNTVHWAK